MKSRKSGILLHITSLSSDFGIGDLGAAAYNFADFLAHSGQTVWQLLPLNPTSIVCGNSPYCSFSAFAGNPLLIAPDLLVKDGYISWDDLSRAPSFDSTRVEYDKVADFKNRVLGVAYGKFRDMPQAQDGYEEFVKANAHWLDDYALFMSLKEHFPGVFWNEWPREIRDRTQPALDEWRQRLAEGVGREKFYQFLFFRQWSRLKEYCNQRHIRIIGDLPIYVSFDSSDVWTNPEYFKLDGDKNPAFVSGVPPDYFSETGQLWGNPVYSWDKLRETSYAWWIRRMEHNLKHFDIVRLDHFRGFVAYWEVPATEKTAVNGKWVTTPFMEFFDTLLGRIPSLSIIAEDLGIITDEVKEVMKKYKFPGMKVLVFAFGDSLSTNPYVPHNHVRNCIVYTGTHDNNTVKGWYQNDASDTEKKNLSAYLGCELDDKGVAWRLIRTAMMSVASTVVIPMQDFLDLGSEARMNTPSVKDGNWEWRVESKQLTADLSEKIANMTEMYGRIRTG